MPSPAAARSCCKRLGVSKAVAEKHGQPSWVRLALPEADAVCLPVEQAPNDVIEPKRLPVVLEFLAARFLASAPKAKPQEVKPKLKGACGSRRWVIGAGMNMDGKRMQKRCAPSRLDQPTRHRPSSVIVTS